MSDKVDEKRLKQLQNVSKTRHPFYLAIYLPIHHYGIHSSGELTKAAPTPASSMLVDGGKNC